MLNFLANLFHSHRPAAATWQPVALTPAQNTRHRRWVAQEVYRNWLGPYFKAYHLRKTGIGGPRGLRVQLLQETGRHGALLFYHDGIGPGNFRHFFEHLGERLLDLGYHRACADRGVRNNAQHTETTLKQLFKPDPTDCPNTGCCDQRYGLVTVDLVNMNGHPVFIRLAANSMDDPCFTPAHPFEALVKALLDAPGPDQSTDALIGEYYESF